MPVTLGYELWRLERLFDENLRTIDQIVGAIASREHYSVQEAAALRRAVRLKITERDYEVLRRFKHRSSLRTYLAVVIERHVLDMRRTDAVDTRLFGRDNVHAPPTR